MYKLDYWIDTAKPKTNAKYEGEYGGSEICCKVLAPNPIHPHSLPNLKTTRLW